MRDPALLHVVVQRRNAPPSEEETEYEVESIVDFRGSSKDGERCLEYRVKWKDYPHEDNTWEHENMLGKCQEAINEFWTQHNMWEDSRCGMCGRRDKLGEHCVTFYSHSSLEEHETWFHFDDCVDTSVLGLI